jgi:hypothetical protein
VTLPYVSHFGDYSGEEILAAAANLRRTKRAARAAALRRARTEARLPDLHEAERRARDLAALGSRLTHVIDGVPIEIVAGTWHDPDAVEVSNLVDRRRWATYVARGSGYRLYPHSWGDCGSTPYVDLPDGDTAQRAAIDWVLGRG